MEKIKNAAMGLSKSDSINTPCKQEEQKTMSDAVEQIKSGALGTAADSGTVPVPEESADEDNTVVGHGSWEPYPGAATTVSQEDMKAVAPSWAKSIFLNRTAATQHW